MAIRTTPKQITYKLLTAFDLAKELDRVGYDVAIQFTTDDTMRRFPWEQPQMHYIMRTRKWSGDNLIAGRMDGGGTMIRSTASYIAPWEENNPRARVYGLNEFASSYLLQHGNGVWRVAVQTATA